MANNVTGFGTPNPQERIVSNTVASMLQSLGIEQVFTIIGGGIAPLIDALHRQGLRIHHFRHEAGAAFAAHEAAMASGKPVAICVTTGPGLLNALTGIAAARADGGRILLLSGSTCPAMRGKGAVQETGFETMPADLFTSSPLFSLARMIADVRELPGIFARLQQGFSSAKGFVAHLAFPLSVQHAQEIPFAATVMTTHEPRAAKQAIDDVIQRLVGHRFGLWLGHGALSATKEIREFVERTQCGVVATPRAKGIFPENNPLYVGVSGAGAHPSVLHYMRTYAPEWLVVVGSRLGEVSSFWNPAMIPTKGFVHIDVDASAFGAGYPEAHTLGIVTESRSFFADLLEQWPNDAPRQTPHGCSLPRRDPLIARNEPRVRTPFLMQELQRIVVEKTNIPILAESGNAFAWTNHALHFSHPHHYRTSAAFGSMGHFVAGVVGAALGRRDKAIVIAGDGAMLMNNEINTAVAYQARAVWIVLNDARYGLTERGMQALELEPVETRMPLTNFAMFAQSQGARGRVVESEKDIAEALQEALETPEPFVLDIRIDEHDVAPMLATRIASLKKQRGG